MRSKKIVSPHEKGVVRRGLCVVVAVVKSQCRKKKSFFTPRQVGKRRRIRGKGSLIVVVVSGATEREREIRESGSPLFTHPKARSKRTNTSAEK